MKGSLINGAYYVLGELKGSTRPGLWLAHSLVTGELVTLAVPGPPGESPTSGELRQEGEIFGDITNRYVQSVVDWSAEDVFVAWEYVPAWSLATALRTSQLPSIGAVLRLMLELAQGLGAVHNRGGVYRGLHPGRILVLRDGTTRLSTTPEAVLAKRGRMVEAGPPPETPIRYLAPEQIEGQVTVSSDLYSLAVVSYELLTGRQVYSGRDPVTLAVEIMETSPPPPSTHRPDVPAEVDDLFAYCLARKPEDRPRNVAALVVYLNKLITNVAGPEIEPLARRLGLHPVAYPLLASDADRAALFEAVSSPVGPPAGTGPDRAEESAFANGGDAGDDWADSVRPAGQDLAAGWEPGSDGAVDTAGDGLEFPAGDDGEVGPIAFVRAENGEEFRLHPPGMVIGRRGANGAKPDIDLRELDSGMVVSREHAALRYHDSAWYALDLRARNGTWVNEEKLAPGTEMPLGQGDRLRLANLELVFGVRVSSDLPAEYDRHEVDAQSESETPTSDAVEEHGAAIAAPEAVSTTTDGVPQGGHGSNE